MVIAVGGYLPIAALLVAGNLSGKLFGLGVLLALLLGFNTWNLRGRVPPFNSQDRRIAGLAWAVLVTSAGVALILSVPPSGRMSDPAPQTASTGGGSVATAARGQQAIEPDPAEISEEAQEYLDSAVEYLTVNQHGLALVALDQALAVEPRFTEAGELRQRVSAEATATVVAQERAIADVARAQATQAAQIQIQAQEAAAARAQQQVQATVTAYSRVPPVGQWHSEAGRVLVGVGGFEYHREVGRFNTAPAGFRFLSFGIYVDNGGSASIHVNPLNVTLVDQQGQTYPYHSSTHSWCNTPLPAVDVRPSNNAQGCLVFLTSATTGPAKVIYRTSAIRGTDVTIDLQRPPDSP